MQVTEEARRVTTFGHISIYAIVKWLGTSVPFYDTTGVPWTDNILLPEVRWRDGGNYETWDLKTKYGVCFGGRSVPWRGANPFLASYLPRSPVNTCATERPVCDVCLQENRLAQAQTLSRAHHTGGDEQVNWSDDNLDG